MSRWAYFVHSMAISDEALTLCWGFELQKSLGLFEKIMQLISVLFKCGENFVSKDGVECVENEAEARNRKLVYSNQGSVYQRSSSRRLIGSDPKVLSPFISDFGHSKRQRFHSEQWQVYFNALLEGHHTSELNETYGLIKHENYPIGNPRFPLKYVLLDWTCEYDGHYDLEVTVNQINNDDVPYDLTEVKIDHLHLCWWHLCRWHWYW